MMAAANAADKKGIPPPALTESWKCDRWGALPNPGGLRDQPMIMMRDMTVASNVYSAISAWQRSKNWVHFQRDYPVAWRIVGEVLKRRREGW